MKNRNLKHQWDEDKHNRNNSIKLVGCIYEDELNLEEVHINNIGGFICDFK